MLREAHAKISEEHRKEKCEEKGRQEINLTQSEIRGLKKLEMTEKSSKMCVMKREDFLKLGVEHVGKDKITDRKELLRREKVLHQH